MSARQSPWIDPARNRRLPPPSLSTGQLASPLPFRYGWQKQGNTSRLIPHQWESRLQAADGKGPPKGGTPTYTARPPSVTWSPGELNHAPFIARSETPPVVGFPMLCGAQTLLTHCQGIMCGEVPRCSSGYAN